MKISRRKILKLFGFSATATVFSPFIGCEKSLDKIINSNIDVKEENAINLVKKFCELNLSGDFYQTYFRKIENDLIPARDFIAVANSYKILSSTSVGNIVIIYVEYDYIGVHKGNDFYFMKSRNGTSKIIAKYKVKNGIILNSGVPFLQTELFKSTIRQSIIFNNASIVRFSNNEFMKNHFIRKNIKYNNLLSLLN